jgi:hypothetical protein
MAMAIAIASSFAGVDNGSVMAIVMETCSLMDVVCIVTELEPPSA